MCAVFTNPDSMTHTVAMLNSQDAYDRCILGGATGTTPIAPGTNVTVWSSILFSLRSIVRVLRLWQAKILHPHKEPHNWFIKHILS